MDRAVPLNAQLSHSMRSRFYSESRFERRDGSTSPVRQAASFIQPPVPPTWEFTRTSPSRSGSNLNSSASTPSRLKPMSLRGAEPHVARICLFSTKTYDREAFSEEADRLNAAMALPGAHHPVRIQITFIEHALGESTMADCPPGTDAVCGFVNDTCSAPVLKFLVEERGVKLLLNRCAGFNNVDMHSATIHGLRVMRVPVYSPESVAEHAVALLMAVNRKTHVAHSRCQNKNFDLQGLEGFAMHGKTVVVLGAGNIGICAAKIYLGFGCKVLYYNRSAKKNLDALGAEHLPMNDPASMERVCAEADVISIHILLNPATFHM
jgi:D-lactate dehydrogenase